MDYFFFFFYRGGSACFLKQTTSWNSDQSFIIDQSSVLPLYMLKCFFEKDRHHVAATCTHRTLLLYVWIP